MRIYMGALFKTARESNLPQHRTFHVIATSAVKLPSPIASGPVRGVMTITSGTDRQRFGNLSAFEAHPAPPQYRYLTCGHRRKLDSRAIAHSAPSHYTACALRGAVSTPWQHQFDRHRRFNAKCPTTPHIGTSPTTKLVAPDLSGTIILPLPNSSSLHFLSLIYYFNVCFVSLHPLLPHPLLQCTYSVPVCAAPHPMPSTSWFHLMAPAFTFTALHILISPSVIFQAWHYTNMHCRISKVQASSMTQTWLNQADPRLPCDFSLFHVVTPARWTPS